MHEIGESGETLDLLCGEQLKIFQGKKGYRFSIDSILLANFVRLKKGERMLDIGTGCGIIPIYMTRRGFQNPMTGVEFQPGLFRSALKNKAVNGCDNVEFLQGDVREGLPEMTKDHFSVIVCNPPYTPKGTGRTSPDNSRHTARCESELDLTLLLSLASSLLPRKGRLYLIYPSKRAGELLYSAKSHRLEPKRLRFIHPRDGEESNLFLAEFLKDGGTGTKVEKPLVIHKDRLYTGEVQSYYSLKR